MKFTQKVFFITFIFVTICINIIGSIIISNTHKQRIEAKMQSNLSNIEYITNVLELYNVQSLSSNMLKRDNTYYEIRTEEGILFTNLFMNIDDIYNEIMPAEDDVKAIIHNEILFMSVKSDSFSIILAEDIHEVFDERRNQISFFMKVSVISSSIMALILYVIIYFLTKRIRRLNIVVNKIANGDYSARSKKMGNDEIGELACRF